MVPHTVLQHVGLVRWWRLAYFPSIPPGLGARYYTYLLKTFRNPQSPSHRQESKPIGHKKCIKTPPSYKHCTIKWRGHVEIS